MLYSKRESLTIIGLEADEQSVSFERLKEVLLKHPSNMIYCESDGKLVGVISTGDITRAFHEKNSVAVNKEFSYITVGRYMQARECFKNNEKINALPVITKENVLIGSYTRWDDFLYLSCILNTGEKYSVEAGRACRDIVIVRPCDASGKGQEIFKKFKGGIESQKAEFKCIEYEKALFYPETNAMLLFVDENEFRAMMTLRNIVLEPKRERKTSLETYKTFLSRAKYGYNSEQNEECFENLRNNNICVLALEAKSGQYEDCLLKKIQDKFAASGEKMSYKLPESMYKDFFDDLYDEEYVEQIMHKSVKFKNKEGLLYLKDCRSQYYNVTAGKRHTSDQPNAFTKSIYFFGPCYIYGHYVEDKNTIESFLQKRICQNEYEVRVVNCGGVGRVSAYMDNRYFPDIVTTPLKKGDIIVVGAETKIKNALHLDLVEVLWKNEADVKWLVDKWKHCNHKVNKLYADAIYDVLEPVLSKKVEGQGELVAQNPNFIKAMYLEQYFSEFDAAKYERIGSIVMNANPFTYGHRHLIETALKTVDFLIIFVVEEDKSIFSFSERFAMVWEGTEDLNNVMVVPSGPFILSQLSFPEYFIKESGEDIVEHTEADITTFAKCIAPQLGIRYRFVGEEPEDAVTNEYNSAMKRILPEYDIELIEIPRKTFQEQYISASQVRKLLEENNMSRLKKLIPATTRRLLGVD